MSNSRFYLSIFIRRLPYFLIVASVISAAAVIAAATLPPAYVSSMRLLVESPQISNELVTPVANVPALEQLQVVRQRLLTRTNLLDVAQRLGVLLDMEELNSDQIVQAMLARTDIEISQGRGDPPLMKVSFEAREAEIAAGVLNEYLKLIQEVDIQARTGRAVQTLEFFEQEVSRLNAELAERSSRILEFKTANIGALPDSLDYRLGQQSLLQERLGQLERDIFGLTSQRERLLEIYRSTGQVAEARIEALTPEQAKLEALKNELSEALAVYSADNPRVKILQARVAQAEAVVSAQPRIAEPAQQNTGNSSLDLQITAIDSRLSDLNDQKATVEEQLAKVADSIDRTPVNAIKLDELRLDYENIQLQYNSAVDRLARASTGERIEFMDRGQRISVIEPPAVPTQPSKPKRVLIAGGGSILGFVAGLALIVALEMMNRSIRRPEDMVRALGVTPLATIPYVQTRREKFMRRGRKLLLLLTIIVGVPAVVYSVHIYYQPLDVIAEGIMNKLGMRW